MQIPGTLRKAAVPLSCLRTPQRMLSGWGLACVFGDNARNAPWYTVFQHAGGLESRCSPRGSFSEETEALALNYMVLYLRAI